VGRDRRAEASLLRASRSRWLDFPTCRDFPVTGALPRAAQGTPAPQTWCFGGGPRWLRQGRAWSRGRFRRVLRAGLPAALGRRGQGPTIRPNMAPEYGATIGYFPVGRERTLSNAPDRRQATSRSARFREPTSGAARRGSVSANGGALADPEYSGGCSELDLGSVAAALPGAVAGRAQDGFAAIGRGSRGSAARCGN